MLQVRRLNSLLISGFLVFLCGCHSESNTKQNVQPILSQTTVPTRQSQPEQPVVPAVNPVKPDPVPSVVVPKPDDVQAPVRKEGAEFTRATDLYGPVIVNEGNWLTDTKSAPWSASWYPISDNGLFHGESAPLRKYDLYVQKTKGKASRAAEYEEKEVYRADAVPWAGRCHAWSIASIAAPDPVLKQPVTLEGITFTTQDLKALLVLSYERMEGLIQFGQRYNGNEESIGADMYADQFHRVLQKELFEKQRPFIMDKDPGVEVWNIPVNKAEVTILKDSQDAHTMHVKAALIGTEPSDPLSRTDDRLRHRVLFEYTYDLVGQPQADGTVKVVFGVWTGSSVKDHPDFLWTLPDTQEHKSANPEIDNAIVQEIIQKTHARHMSVGLGYPLY